MAKLEDIKPNCQVKGLLPNDTVTILNTKWVGADIVEVAFRTSSGSLREELLFRDRQNDLEVIQPGAAWGFDADPAMFRLVSEAYRIRMAHLFDPWLAVHLSQVDPLPHQITAVYGEMLPRQPLKFLLADDPGAGKTIMAGLYIKELILRGDLQRCLIVAPGNLTEQWQDELWQKFQLPFQLLTNEKIEAAHTGNALAEMSLVIARLDKLSRDEDLQSRLMQTEWDLVVVDEAHKMSASVFGGEIKYTKRYNLGKKLIGLTRHLLLLTATPHNGKEEDFQLFMALLDPDRFEGRYREGVHSVNVSDVMRRMVKEHLLKFDGTPLFPERRAYTVDYDLSDIEAVLYQEVTRYVTEEFNRAENLNAGRRGNVGFALTMLQRRLASSPEAIYQSLLRRKKRLESKLREAKILHRGASVSPQWVDDLPFLDEEQFEDFDDAPEEEQEQLKEQIIDLATAARSIQELRIEIEELNRLKEMADKVRRSGIDRKWQELSNLLQENEFMFDRDGARRKLVIFTEHRDTLNYLAERIRTLLGRPESVVIIHGGLRREDRRSAQEVFVQNKDIHVLVATDAAGEGINLQRANLMVNYDLPWNPARIEQRFGRIHRIGQTEVCHLWNLVADETREGDVYTRLLNKIEEQRRALGDGVFDILGKLFRERSLRDLLIEAIRYGDRPDVRARLVQAVDNLIDRQRCQDLLDEKALAHDAMDTSQVQRVRQEFERAQARRLQPHFIESFFKAAFEQLGGSLHKRENHRYEIKKVPAVIRNRSLNIGLGRILEKYERVTFYKDEINLPGKPTAEFLCPGHPLMDAVIDLVLERYRTLLRQGAVFLDENDPSEEPRLLVYLETSIKDGIVDKNGQSRIIARQMQFVEMNASDSAQPAGPAPFLDYQPLLIESIVNLEEILSKDWLHTDIDERARTYAVLQLIPEFFSETKQAKEHLIDRIHAAVKERLTKEISYWDHRAQDLKAQEQAGRINTRLNSQMAQRRADDLQSRLESRLGELERERHLSPQPPLIIGAALIIPAGLIYKISGQNVIQPAVFAQNRREVELAAMQAVLEKEKELGYFPADVSKKNLGWDIESEIANSGKLRFIEVKGRVEGADTITVSKNEILAGLNKPEDYYLVVVEIIEKEGKLTPKKINYIIKPYQREPDFAATSVNYKIIDLLKNSKTSMMNHDKNALN